MISNERNTQLHPIGKGESAADGEASGRYAFSSIPRYCSKLDQTGKVHMQKNNIKFMPAFLATALLAQVAMAQTSDSTSQPTPPKTSSSTIHLNKLIGAEV